MQRLLDQLVRDEGAVEVGGVDVRDAELDDLAEHGERLVAVGGRAEDVGAGELHRAVADAVDGDVVGEREGAAGDLVG